jgi:hypothetical protein
VVRNKTPADHWVTIEDTEKEKELSQQGKIYFCRRVRRHTGTAHTKGQAVCPSLYSWYDWPCLLIWIGPDQKFTIFLVDWNSILTQGRS